MNRRNFIQSASLSGIAAGMSGAPLGSSCARDESPIDLRRSRRAELDSAPDSDRGTEQGGSGWVDGEGGAGGGRLDRVGGEAAP